MHSINYSRKIDRLFLFADPCSLIKCAEGYECLIYEETGEGYCSPNCEDLNPCESQEQCVITDVDCFRAPCPGVLSCEGIYIVPIL